MKKRLLKDENHINEKQKQIIDYLLRFRYLNSIQIQQLLNQKSKTNVFNWLHSLIEKQYIFAFYKKEIAPKPTVYCLGKGIISYLRKSTVVEKKIRRIYFEKMHSQQFRESKVLAASVYISLLALTNKTKGILSFQTKEELHGIKYLIYPAPDLYFSIKDVYGRTKRYFLDIFTDESFIKKRVYQHLSYFRKRYWHHHTSKPYPEIILIFPDYKLKRKSYAFIQKKLKDSPLFYLSTCQEILTKGLHKDILEKVI